MVEAAQTAILAIAPLLDSRRIQDSLLFCLDNLTDCTEHEVRSAVMQLYAKLGAALEGCEGCENLLQDTILPKLLEAAEDMDFQVRRVRAQGLSALCTDTERGLVTCSLQQSIWWGTPGRLCRGFPGQISAELCHACIWDYHNHTVTKAGYSYASFRSHTWHTISRAMLFTCSKVAAPDVVLLPITSFPYACT